MLCVQAFHPGDIDQSLRFAMWVRELGGCKGHNLLLIRDTRCDPARSEQIRALFVDSFDSVEVLDFVDHFKKWYESPNSIFSTAARYIENTKPQPWLFCEPDTVPIKPGWIDTLWQEYTEAKKPFLGAYVDVNGVIPHCSGNAIYPGQMTRFAGNALIAGDTEPWDVAAADQMVPQMHRSKHIHHAWKCPGFADWAAFEREVLAFTPEVVLFHSDKTSSLIDLLRARKNFSGSAFSAQADGDKRRMAATAEEGTAPKPVQVNADASARRSNSWDIKLGATDILIKSYPKDYEWLSYCLRAIEKFATGFRRIVLVIPIPVIPPPIEGLNKTRLAVLPVKENGEGYLFQQAIKASAHEFTDADYILHIDSDVILTQPITPASFFHDGKPTWYFTPYHAIDVPWQPITERFLGEPVHLEFMRRFPICVPRKLHIAASAFCMAHHKMRLTDYILSQPHRAYSEFNCLGALAYSRAREDFHWINTLE